MKKEKEKKISKYPEFQAWGIIGGKKLLKKKGKKYYRELGKLGSAKRWGKKFSTGLDKKV